MNSLVGPVLSEECSWEAIGELGVSYEYPPSEQKRLEDPWQPVMRWRNEDWARDKRARDTGEGKELDS